MARLYRFPGSGQDAWVTEERPCDQFWCHYEGACYRFVWPGNKVRSERIGAGVQDFYSAREICQ